MAVEVVMPRLGWTMETGAVAEWLKHDGDTVQPGDILFTVETDKVAQEVEAMDGGVLRLAPDSPPPGQAVPVGTVLAYLLEPGEPLPFAQGTAGATTTQAAAPPQGLHEAAMGRAPSSISATVGGDGRAVPAASPRARRVARELGVDWATLSGSGRTGRIVERDVRAAAAAQPVAAGARVTPLARRAAQQSGVDIDDLAARMPGKRITRADVEAAAPAAEGLPAGPVTPFSAVRRIIAERMVHSAHTAAPVTLTTEADATELAATRERIKRALAGSDRPVPTYNDLLARLAALALLEHPALNSSLGAGGIIMYQAVHIGIAVDTPQGLLVPVVRDAHLKSVQRIAAESAALIERARTGKAAPDDLRGGTFTITNLGMYEIDAFTPIINLPECAILGLGRIVARPVVVDEDAETVAVRKMMALSLTFDHRLVDGAPAARFLQQIKRWVEQPDVWLTA